MPDLENFVAVLLEIKSHKAGTAEPGPSVLTRNRFLEGVMNYQIFQYPT